MKKSTTIVIVALVLVLVLAIAAFAQVQPSAKRVGKQQRATTGTQNGAAAAQMPGWQRPAPEVKGAFVNLQRLLMPPSMRELQRLGLVLNLTEEQKTKVQELYKSFHSTMKQIAPQRAEAVKAVIQAMQQPNPSNGDLQSASNKVQQLDNAILNAEFDFWTGFKGILNTQQQGQVQNFMMQRVQNELAPRPNTAAPPTPRQ